MEIALYEYKEYKTQSPGLVSSLENNPGWRRVSEIVNIDFTMLDDTKLIETRIDEINKQLAEVNQKAINDMNKLLDEKHRLESLT